MIRSKPSNGSFFCETRVATSSNRRNAMNDHMLLNLPLSALHDGGVHRNNVLMWHMATCTVNML